MKAAEIELRKVLELKESGKGKKNYSIKAGAGGGKTTLLSKRICRQIQLLPAQVKIDDRLLQLLD